ncbi:MAG TPA: PhzF family phenazine biosynthesis protein [Thermoanaerobaculia bacterium]|nr:PhzF family phenazine biosynthesis protein [Thermoanaerobaculia bacterium]
MKRRFVLVDVFGDRPFAGNPLAVFPEAGGLSDGEMQAVAREMDHPATSFLLPSALPGAAFRLRIFSREREIPFAGHPALGAHYVHATENRLPLTEPLTRVAHEGSEGLFQVELKVDRAEITLLRLKQRLPVAGPKWSTDDTARLSRALGLEEEEIAATNQPARVVSTGLPVLIVPVSTLDALGNARPRYGELAEMLAGRSGEPGEATIVYAFTKETRDARAAAHARAFDAIGSVEIPGAGAAAGALATYLVAQAAITILPTTSLVIEQGHVLGRPSTISVEVQVKEGKVVQVVMGGRVIKVGDGELEV